MFFLQHGPTFFFVAIVALFTRDVVGQINADIDPCDPITINTNCLALVYSCVDDCLLNGNTGYSTACVEACGNETNVCSSVTAVNCFDSEGCQAMGLCVPSDAPIYTEPCNAATIALPCTFKLNECVNDTSSTVETCTSEQNACVAQGTEGCGLNNNGGSGNGNNGFFGNGGTNGSGASKMVPFFATSAFMLLTELWFIR